MKKSLFIVVLLLSAVGVMAQSHRLGLHLMAGYDNIALTRYATLREGAMTGVGFNYEYSHEPFLLQIGFSGNYAYSAMSCNAYSGTFANMIDEDGDECLFHYELTGKTDQIHQIAIMPHVLAGGQWGNFYFLAGLGAQIYLYGQANTSGLLTTKGEYENLILPLEAMTNHYFVNAYPLQNRRLYSEMDYKGCILAMGEIGAEIPRLNYHHNAGHTIHRLAVFAYYGLMNISNRTDGLPIIDFHLQSDQLKDIRFEDISIQPLVGSDVVAPKEVHPFAVGIRWTILFQISQTTKCMCNKHY